MPILLTVMSSNAGLVCFICHRRFSEAKLLMKHLASVKSHNLNQHSYFKCAQESCGREYTNSRSFSRHLKKEHPQNLAVDWTSNRIRMAQPDNISVAEDIR